MSAPAILPTTWAIADGDEETKQDQQTIRPLHDVLPSGM
jgi:hypothetical protein